MDQLERRQACELRVMGSTKAPKLGGYAAVFNSPSQDLGGFVEVIRPGSFKRTLAGDSKQDPLALVEHMPHLVLGRRSAGTLRLSEDGKGLAFEIDIPDITAARDLMVSVERGDIKGASFGFRTVKDGESWNFRSQPVTREITDLDLVEITVTANPAYLDTSVNRRALLYQTAPRLAAATRFLRTL
jgi:uncharacterized protein